MGACRWPKCRSIHSGRTNRSAETTARSLSCANFYISNAHVIVSTYRDANDERALGILRECFPGRPVIGLDSTDMIWGLGSFHCLIQQEPEAK